ncbi:tail fiber protein [Photorhabdus aegyptia]|uniref:Phage tail collar family protein n=1 Tax=Photorhabdus aegyptia TaxID=2805098 RepID=A0A022PDV2_9GAMM|nr:tail fiber protein [Photorhabdus aegyptia]EYU13881.1 phage tail collar family protein [Photorhabdus aegyptia]
MEKEYNIKNSEVNLENTKIESKGPSTDDLKSRFKEGSIPLQADYADLINIADIGRKATGQAPQQNGPGLGLKLDDNGTLNLKMGTIPSKDFSPLILEKDILSVDLGSGLINKDNGISVGEGKGIVVNTDDVAVKAAADGGIKVDDKGVSVKYGDGISVNGNGVEVKAKDKGSISVEPDGIAVKCWDGGGIVVTDNTGLYLKLEGGNSSNAWSGVSGLSLSTKGVKVKAGNGIKVDDKGVSIDPNKVLPRGMIVMFSGSSVPEGWALCDGNNGTPNLIDRFILGGDFSGVKGQSNTKVSGPKDGKSFSFNSDEATLNINGRTNERSLSIGQIPNHNHLSGIIIDTEIMAQHGYYKIDSNKRAVASSNNTNNRYLYYSTGMTTSKGVVNGNSPETHNHDIDVKNTGKHSHSNKITVPYYILAFIMKL